MSHEKESQSDGKKPANPSDYSENALCYLKNFCYVWRPDGPLIQEYRNKMMENPKMDKEVAG